jgi:hypothetical protein
MIPLSPLSFGMNTATRAPAVKLYAGPVVELAKVPKVSSSFVGNTSTSLRDAV